MNIKVLMLAESTKKAEMLAEFDRPIDDGMKHYLMKDGFAGGAAHSASSCMGWIWRQWLLGGESQLICEKVKRFVARGLELRSMARSYHKLPLHDLYLLHCAIFASGDAQLKLVAESIADASGDKGEKPLDVGYGELYAAAWSGMMKYWMLGDHEKAVEQSDLIWGAYRESGVMAATKPLVSPWLKRDWNAFNKAQQKDFEKLWNRARKDRWTVREENAAEIVVTTERYQIEHQWCWAHCGMALLAYRRGVGVATDPFWFPSHALKVVDYARRS